MNTPVWPKDKLMRTPPELPMDERVRRYQHNIITIRESGCLVPSALVDSLDEGEIRAWFEAGERRIAALKTAIRAVAKLPVDEDGYAVVLDGRDIPASVAQKTDDNRRLLGDLILLAGKQGLFAQDFDEALRLLKLPMDDHARNVVASLCLRRR